MIICNHQCVVQYQARVFAGLMWSVLDQDSVLTPLFWCFGLEPPRNSFQSQTRGAREHERERGRVKERGREAK